MITIIDYGLGNIRAFLNVYQRIGINVMIGHNVNDIKNATKLILPGVGSFDYAMKLLNSSGLRSEVEKQVFENKIPLIGICVGMQMLAKSSDEGMLPGLGWIDGKVKKFNTHLIPFKTQLPHMGWNTILIKKSNNLLDNLSENTRFYFLHSYYFECNNADDIIAETEYGLKFSSAVNNKNIYGIQFHPEKSHSNGVHLLHNFANL
jgi:glutamine amidotransferase